MKPEVPEQYPETPAWTMFFDGPLYQKYDEFMKGLDFSKILLTSKLKLANSDNGDTKSQTPSKHDDWWEGSVDADIDSKIANPNIYSSVSEEYYQNLKDDRDRRKRRTRAFIVLALIIMAALAFGTALVIHYFFIPSDEDLSSNVNISLSENITGKLLETSSIINPTKSAVPIVTKTGDMDQILNKFTEFDNKVKKKIKPTRKPKEILTTIPTRQWTKTTLAQPTTPSPMMITTTTKNKRTTSFYDLYDFFGIDDQTTTSEDPFNVDTSVASTTEMNNLQTTLDQLTTTATTSTENTFTASTLIENDRKTTSLSKILISNSQLDTSTPHSSSSVSQFERTTSTTIGDNTTSMNKTRMTTSDNNSVTTQVSLSTTKPIIQEIRVDKQESTTLAEDISTNNLSAMNVESTTIVEQTTLPDKYSKSS